MHCFFQTRRFNLRALSHADLQAFAKYRAIPSVAEFQSWTDYRYCQAVNLLATMDYTDFGTPGNWYQLAITDHHNPTILYGDLALHFIDEQQVELGFTVAPQFQAQGVAYEVVKGALNYLFDGLGKHRVIAITDSRNLPATKLLQKTGFRRETHFHQNILFKGQYADEYLYALLKQDYCHQVAATPVHD